MAENEHSFHPPDYLPSLPAPEPRPVPPPGMDAAEYRRFQEFQRFHEYQRSLEQSGAPPGVGPPGVAMPYNGTSHGTASDSPPAHQDIAEQLAGVREHSVELATTQATINQTINPPLWRRLLRSRLVSRLLWLGVIVIVVVVGTPLLIDNLFGNVFGGLSGDHPNLDDPNVVAHSLPPPKEISRELPRSSPDTVYVVYEFVAYNHPAAACFLFSLAAQIEFANAVGAPNCQTAVTTLHRQVTDPATYADPNLRDLPTPRGRLDSIPSCEFTVNGGPRLGIFGLTEYVTG